MTHQEYADGLRQLADWYERHPTIPLPQYSTLSVHGAEDVAYIARALGKATKGLSGSQGELFTLHRVFGSITLKFFFWRKQVCTRRIVRIEEVPAQTFEAYTREIVEWDCESILGAPGGNAHD